MARTNLKRDLRDLVGKRQQRTFTISREAPAFDEAARTVPMALTSDEPIFHGFAYIILDHSPASINLERFTGGLALLENHDSDRRLGRLRNPETNGHVLRANARFSTRPYADEIFREVVEDLKAGDVPGTSSMFTIDEIADKPEGDIEGYPVFRATKWTIYEGSVVSIPADISVGVGRSMEDDDEERAKDEREKREEVCEECDGAGCDACGGDDDDEEERAAREGDPKTDSGGERAAPTPSIQVRTAMENEKKLIELGELIGEVEMARDFLLANKTVAEFRAAVIEKRKNAPPPVQKPLVELNEAEQRRYSICRAIMADASDRHGYEGEKVKASFELDIHQEIDRKLDKSVRRNGGIFIPTVVSREQLVRAGLDSKTSTKGSEVVFTEPGDFIQLLRNKALVLALGARMLAGLQGNIAFPRQTGAGTFTWTGENPGSDVAESNLLLDQVTMSPKTGQSTTSYSRQLLTQGVISVDQLVMDDLAQIAALEIDRVSLHGSGSSNQPRGIYNTSGIGSVAFGGPITFPLVVDMETAVAGANADIGTMAYLTTTNIRGTAKKTAKLSNTIAEALWEDGEMNGYRAEASNNVSKTLGTGSDHGIVFGVWGQLVIGEWGALEIITDPYAKKKQGMIEVTEFLMIDVAARQAAAFCKGTTLVP
ncbi:MAG TPA: phage major capsid protein [Pyrinomonadaceae bacterium]|nr:phage major capsid protein [Pyrinomonadaceae bacterium]